MERLSANDSSCSDCSSSSSVWGWSAVLLRTGDFMTTSRNSFARTMNSPSTETYTSRFFKNKNQQHPTTALKSLWSLRRTSISCMANVMAWK